MCLRFFMVSRGKMTMIDGRGCVFRMGMGDSEVCDSCGVPCVRDDRGGGGKSLARTRARHASTRGRRRSIRGGTIDAGWVSSRVATGRIGRVRWTTDGDENPSFSLDMAGSKKKSASKASTAASTAGGATKFEDIFEVIDRDPDGKKFDRVSRYMCRSEFDAELTIDVNVDAYPLSVGQRFSLALASTLSLDGSPEDDSFDQSGKPSLADGYEYVMYGKCYKKVEENAGGLTRASAFISFGGLLANLKADPKNLQEIEIDDRIYLLMRAV